MHSAGACHAAGTTGRGTRPARLGRRGARNGLLIAALLLALGRTSAAQTCTRPQPPVIPSGANADLETMRTVRNDVDAYLDRMQAYVDCLARESEAASAEADRVVDQWNVALQNFENKP